MPWSAYRGDRARGGRRVDATPTAVEKGQGVGWGSGATSSLSIARSGALSPRMAAMEASMLRVGSARSHATRCPAWFPSWAINARWVRPFPSRSGWAALIQRGNAPGDR